ncbi:MAG: hypothetical protein ABI691_06640 [Ginsengibacter sp.]
MQPVFLFLTAGKINRASPLQTYTPIHLEYLQINFFATMLLKISCSRIAGKILHLRHLSEYCRQLFKNADDIIDVNIIEDPNYKVFADK